MTVAAKTHIRAKTYNSSGQLVTNSMFESSEVSWGNCSAPYITAAPPAPRFIVRWGLTHPPLLIRWCPPQTAPLPPLILFISLSLPCCASTPMIVIAIIIIKRCLAEQAIDVTSHARAAYTHTHRCFTSVMCSLLWHAKWYQLYQYKNVLQCY